MQVGDNKIVRHGRRMLDLGGQSQASITSIEVYGPSLPQSPQVEVETTLGHRAEMKVKVKMSVT